MEEVKENNAGLTADDLVAYQRIIEIAVSRGAFQASESSMVGAVYDRLKAFNEYIARQATQKKEEESERTETN